MIRVQTDRCGIAVASDHGGVMWNVLRFNERLATTYKYPHQFSSLPDAGRRILFVEEYAADLLARRHIQALYILEFRCMSLEIFEDDICGFHVQRRQTVDCFLHSGDFRYTGVWRAKE